ncbi:poly-gamma-glutamate synthase PgsB [Micromonospora halophytica]|uniref:Poly-gamma-glutamate synthase PgsB/CapB n=1 Tax=Micromonospora halophytica TaxID=47864 RepID=A0A1C5IYL5_9ACTN|nr:poly-gamma-glutamate synthase PgsB [Micromonospora halophytica]SCG63410.1 poly-gamma-glutamate synthase PgsB/CapB [Micromonospora halophytica]
MLFLYVVFVLACLGLLAAGVVEQRNHHKSLHSIPHRVLVNGIRGKSSITRLCAGALRGGKLTVVAKTTGTAARFIFPDASEEPVYRKFGIANVVEQIGIVRRAASYFPDVLVIECMAVMPPLQELNQTKLIQSTIGILCNVREDHLAEMGPTLDDVARSLSRSMPVGGICVTAEKDRLHILQEEADRRQCKLVAVDPESVTDEEMKGFSWTTFKENVAIVLAVAELLGVSRRDALKGMWTAPPDPGVLSVEEYRADAKSLRFANIFAANDPESTFMNIQQLQAQGSIPRPLHVLINCRPDRVERNGQMGSLVSRIDPDKVILIGDPTRSARVKIDDKWQDRVVDLGGKLEAGELLDGVLGTIDRYASVLAIGNIHGQGEILLAQLERLERPAPHESAVPSAGHAPAVPVTDAPTEVVLPRQVQAVRSTYGRPASAPPAQRAAAGQAPGGLVAAGPSWAAGPRGHAAGGAEAGLAATWPAPPGPPPAPPGPPPAPPGPPPVPAQHHDRDRTQGSRSRVGPDPTSTRYSTAEPVPARPTAPGAAGHHRPDPQQGGWDHRQQGHGDHAVPSRPPAGSRSYDHHQRGSVPGGYGPDAPPEPGRGPGAAAYRALAEDDLGGPPRGSDAPYPGWSAPGAAEQPAPGWNGAGHPARYGPPPDDPDQSGRPGSAPGPPPWQRPSVYRSPE